MLSASPDGGVQMALDGDNGSSCRAWYPAGHSFSDAEKKMALNAYASKLGLPVAASDVRNGCSLSPAAGQPRARDPFEPSPPVAAAPSVAAPEPRPSWNAVARPGAGQGESRPITLATISRPPRPRWGWNRSR